MLVLMALDVKHKLISLQVQQVITVVSSGQVAMVYLLILLSYQPNIPQALVMLLPDL